MKIYNEDKTQILENPDLKLGYLKHDKMIIKTIPATEEIKEKFHYETIEKFPNGGEAVKKIVDIVGVPAKPESYEYEDIQVYVLYTKEELKNQRIEKIKQRLDKLNEDFIQFYLGAVIPDIEERKIEFISLHNELREFLEKEPRIYK